MLKFDTKFFLKTINTNYNVITFVNYFHIDIFHINVKPKKFCPEMKKKNVELINIRR